MNGNNNNINVDQGQNVNNSQHINAQGNNSNGFHAGAPIFHPRQTSGNSLLDTNSNLTASAQPFVPSSVRHHISNENENLSTGVESSSMLINQSHSYMNYNHQNLMYVGDTLQGIDDTNINGNNKANSLLYNPISSVSSGYHSHQNHSFYSNNIHSDQQLNFGQNVQNPNLNDTNKVPVNPFISMDIVEYCRRVRGWNLPFLKSIPQMNAITQIRHELQLQNISLLLTQNDIQETNNPHIVPSTVQRTYYSLCLLDDPDINPTTRFCGYSTYAYKAINVEDYSAYCLRRIDGFSVNNFENCKSILDKWQKLPQHPCIVSYRQSFISLDFPPGSLIVVYDYIPNASTMESVHFKEPISEPLLWNYIIQLVLALVHIHSSNFAARVIDPTKVLISYRGRIRLNCVGILDLCRIDNSKTISDYQKQDLVALGYIILALCCGSLTIINDLNHAVEHIFLKSSNYSNDLKKLVLILLSKLAINKSNLDIFILANMLAARMIPQIEHSLKLTDALESEFKKEIDNGRLFRLLSKINMIADRNKLNTINTWNETGDRYICKLFREYLFQQDDSHGRPIIDMGHILDALAKVDVGVSETVSLMSSDGTSILLVTYSDIKRCIEKSFFEIVAASTSNIQTK